MTTESAPPPDVEMQSPQKDKDESQEEPRYGGYTRFEIELEVRPTAIFPLSRTPMAWY